MDKQQLNQLIEDGFTPEDIYTEALRIQEAKDAAKNRMKTSALENKRNVLLDALKDYLSELCEKDTDEAVINSMEKELVKIEKELLAMKKMDKNGKYKHIKVDKDLTREVRDLVMWLRLLNDISIDPYIVI